MPAADLNDKSLLVLFFRKEHFLLGALILSLGLTMARPCSAMDMPSWDLDSLTFTSTDIVEAEVGSAGGADASEAIVTKVLAGKLHVGSKVPGLRFILNFFYPNPKAGDHVILFLDGRVRTDRLLMPRVAETPFLVLPSGLFMIDAAGRVHRYHQFNNPGPYNEEGVPTAFEVNMREVNLQGHRQHPASDLGLDDRDWQQVLDRRAREGAKLPKLAAVETDIVASLAYSAPLHSLLDTPADRARVPALMGLLRERQQKDRAALRLNQDKDQLLQDAIDRIVALQDSRLMLEAYAFGYVPPSQFTELGALGDQRDYRPSRVSFVVDVLTSTKEGLRARLSAAEILAELMRVMILTSRDGKPIPVRQIDRDPWGATHRAVVETAGMRILRDERETPALRVLCARLLDLDDPGQVTGAAKIWSATRADEVRFAIEGVFLRHKDADYDRLHLSAGPVTTIVRSWPDPEWEGDVPTGKIRYWAASHEGESFWKHYPPDGAHLDRMKFYFTLRDLKTHQQQSLKFQQGGGETDGLYGYVDLDRKTTLGVGVYKLAFVYTWDGKVISGGHGIEVTVAASKEGNVIETPASGP
jgi:hypothetical protein